MNPNAQKIEVPINSNWQSKWVEGAIKLRCISGQFEIVLRTDKGEAALPICYFMSKPLDIVISPTFDNAFAKSVVQGVTPLD